MSVRLTPGVLGMLVAFGGWVPVALAANSQSSGANTVRDTGETAVYLKSICSIT